MSVRRFVACNLQNSYKQKILQCLYNCVYMLCWDHTHLCLLNIVFQSSPMYTNIDQLQGYKSLCWFYYTDMPENSLSQT